MPSDRLALLVFGSLFLAMGTAGIAGARYGWFHSNLWNRLDVFDMNRMLDQPGSGGGRNRVYRSFGWLFVTIGVCFLSYFALSSG